MYHAGSAFWILQNIKSGIKVLLTNLFYFLYSDHSLGALLALEETALPGLANFQELVNHLLPGYAPLTWPLFTCLNHPKTRYQALLGTALILQACWHYWNSSILNLLTLPYPLLPSETTVNAFTCSFPLFLLTNPGAVSSALWRALPPSLGICVYNRLSFQWQLSVGLTTPE